MRELPTALIQPASRHAWLWEPLEMDATFVLRSMFGFKAVYLDGKLMGLFCAKTEPWRGLMVCTERAHHASLLADFPALSVHPILGKWLYLSEAESDFETMAQRLVRLARQRDPRIGVIPKPKKKKNPVSKNAIRLG